MANQGTTTSRRGRTKAEQLAKEIAKAVRAGEPVAMETVDFSDPDRPKTCLEVDFPILNVNEIAAIEGNAGKPIYQMSKWWARRRSSIFRAMLLAAAMRAPKESGRAAKAVWEVFYCNHQKKGAFSHLKVADVFMGGGTTIVEGSRLGMQMFGNDLNPVAWLIVKNATAQVDREEVEALLAAIEEEVKPQIQPFYTCDCPRGHRGTWTDVESGEVMAEDFDPLALEPEERPRFRYHGPEVIYVFWAKHGPCQVTGCGHRTPIMSSPVMAVKSLTVRFWEHECPHCGTRFHVEEKNARMAPGVPLVVAEDEAPFAVLEPGVSARCPACGAVEKPVELRGKPQRKKVQLTLLVHPEWLVGESGTAPNGEPYGGSVTDEPEATVAWNEARAGKIRLIEVRGELPEEVTCPATGMSFCTGNEDGPVPRSGHFTCGACGTVQRIVNALEASGKSAPVTAFAVQGYCPTCDGERQTYGGRFFIPCSESDPLDAAIHEWAWRKNRDLEGFWPRSDIPFGHMTHQRQPLPQHGYLNWENMFNPRQLLVHTQLLRCIAKSGAYGEITREYLLGAMQQYLRNQSMFCFWNPQRDTLEPMFSNANYHPKAILIENCAFQDYGRGNWSTCSTTVGQTAAWAAEPWDLAGNAGLTREHGELSGRLSGKSSKISPHDFLVANGLELTCCSATELQSLPTAGQDLVITDPPFGGLLHYSELADFFYVWLRLGLKDRYPDLFGPEYTPKTLEAVSNRARHPADADAFYQRLLTACWREAHRILKAGGLLAFTFHHSEDAPWVAVLESLFEAGFYLEVTYPIRSDETKGKGEFGSKKIEYDIIHVCRKRSDAPQSVSWARLRRQILHDVRQLQELLEHHQKAGLPEADLQVIRRGKALEYYSRHYGEVRNEDGEPISVGEALLGINQLLDEEMGLVDDPPPLNADPLTRQFLRLFHGREELPRDQMTKYLRGTGVEAGDFVELGWCEERKKVFYLTPPLELARAWQGRQRRVMTRDYDQAMFLVGACVEGSGINATSTLDNPHFKPHQELAQLLEWLAGRSPSHELRTAASRAGTILRSWRNRRQEQPEQIPLFDAQETSS